jgi:hypothetical protein
MKFKFKHKRPKRKDLDGLSLSELKTLLKQMGHKFPRNFCRSWYVSKRNDRLYRWRWWGEFGFRVDISEPLDQFDRWANSTEKTVDFSTIKKGML